MEWAYIHENRRIRDALNYIDGNYIGIDRVDAGRLSFSLAESRTEYCQDKETAILN